MEICTIKFKIKSMKKVVLMMALTLSSVLSFGQTKLNESPTVQLVRNATLVINYAGKKILIDPNVLSSANSIAGLRSLRAR